MKPPPLPSGRRPKTLFTIALWNGGSVLAVAGFSALICLLLKLWLGVLVGVLIAASGMMELWGRQQAKAGKAAARFWMPLSQIWLLIVLVGYCVWSMNHSELNTLLPRMMPLFESAGYGPEEIELLMKQMVVVTYGTIILVSLFYQGGLAWYYMRATKALAD